MEVMEGEDNEKKMPKPGVREQTDSRSVRQEKMS